MSVPTLSRRKFPSVGGRKVREGAKREGPKERGYDYIWSKLSERFRKKNPFCKFCEQEGLEVTPADVVDHIIPVTDRTDLRLTWSNLQSLCNSHHNGLKRRLEEIARNKQCVDSLPEWCDEPSTRPSHRDMRRY